MCIRDRFEHLYKVIREQDWYWNWAKKSGITFAQIDSTNTYTWIQGTDYLLCANVPTITYSNVGRFVKLGTRKYRVRMVDSAAFRVYLDAPISEATITDGVTLSFFRGDLLIRTSRIKHVFIDELRITSRDPGHFVDDFKSRYRISSAGRPTQYTPNQDFAIPEPTYAPRLVASPTGTITAGKRYYFYTFVDVESGQESGPGPILTVESASLDQHTIGYDNPLAADLTEGPGYTLRLYRSLDSPYDTKRFPAYHVADRSPHSATNIVDNLSDLVIKKNDRYYSGNATLIEYDKWPDVVYAVDIAYLNDFGGRPSQEDLVEVGTNNIVQELLHIGAAAFVSSKASMDNDRDKNMFRFRSQMAYLLKKAKKPNASDYSKENTKEYPPYGEHDSYADRSIIDTLTYP